MRPRNPLNPNPSVFYMSLVKSYLSLHILSRQIFFRLCSLLRYQTVEWQTMKHTVPLNRTSKLLQSPSYRTTLFSISLQGAEEKYHFRLSVRFINEVCPGDRLRITASLQYNSSAAKSDENAA